MCQGPIRRTKQNEEQPRRNEGQEDRRPNNADHPRQRNRDQDCARSQKDQRRCRDERNQDERVIGGGSRHSGAKGDHHGLPQGIEPVRCGLTIERKQPGFNSDIRKAQIIEAVGRNVIESEGKEPLCSLDLKWCQS